MMDFSSFLCTVFVVVLKLIHQRREVNGVKVCMKSKRLIFIILVGSFALCIVGFGNGSNPASVRLGNGYYNVNLDYSEASSYEVGRQYAMAIRSVVPEYEQWMDRFLKLQIAYLEKMGLTFHDIKIRAQTLLDHPGFDQGFRDEITGMQDVFNHPIDQLGDGRLSRNELLVIQFFPDVMRAFSCSASAAYGIGTVSGKTIIGRNLEWIIDLVPELGKLHAITTFRKGERTIVNIGVLGQLFATSIFNTHKVFAAILDSAATDFEISPMVFVPYPQDLTSLRSYGFDLRFALENLTTLDQVTSFMTDPSHLYAFDHLIFVADETSAGVVENEIHRRPVTVGNRGLRTESSVLNVKVPDDQQWPIRGAFASVNDFRLPGNDYAHALSDTARWTSFKKLYEEVFFAGKKVDAEIMKRIMGYHPPESGMMEDGAIFVNEVLPEGYEALPGTYVPLMFTTIQSIVMDMSTMDLWISFTPWDHLLKDPIYQKIENPIMGDS